MGRRGGPRRRRRRGERAAGSPLPGPLGPPRAGRLSRRVLGLVAATLLSLAACAPEDGDDASAAFVEWVRDFASTLEPPLDEPSGLDADAELGFTREWLAELRAIPPDRLGPEERLDWRFAESLLAGREIALADRRQWARDPARHLPLAELDAALAEAGTGDAAELDALLEALPRRLGHGRGVLEANVPRLRERALRLSHRIAALVAESGRPATATALQALEEWRDFLRETVARWPRSGWALGNEAYARLLRDQHLLEQDALALWRRAERGVEESTAALEELTAGREPGADWRAVVRREAPAPGVGQWEAALGEARHRALTEVGTQPTPGASLKLLPSVGLVASRCGHRAALRARSPAAPGRLWLFDATGPRRAGELQVAAAHHVWPGHHLQELRQIRHPRLLRRLFGSRLFEEGWALYAEQRLLETGAGPDVRLRVWALRARRAAALAVDVGLHTGRLELGEATELLQSRGALAADEARDEVDAVLARPGRHLGLVGLDALLALREDVRRRDGAGFALRSFHERVLGVGSLPPALLREAVLSHGR